MNGERNEGGGGGGGNHDPNDNNNNKSGNDNAKLETLNHENAHPVAREYDGSKKRRQMSQTPRLL